MSDSFLRAVVRSLHPFEWMHFSLLFFFVYFPSVQCFKKRFKIIYSKLICFTYCWMHCHYDVYVYLLWKWNNIHLVLSGGGGAAGAADADANTALFYSMFNIITQFNSISCGAYVCISVRRHQHSVQQQRQHWHRQQKNC